MSEPTAPAVRFPSVPTSNTLRAKLDGRHAEGRTLDLDEAVTAMVALCLDLQARHARGEHVYVHPSCVEAGADGLTRLVPRLAVLPTSPRDRAAMAPELQKTLAPGGARASVFAVGAILYEALTGQSVGPAMRRPREVNPALPAAVEVVLSKVLVADPAHRPDDLGALASALYLLASRKGLHPPDVDTSTLDKTSEFEVDVTRSLLPPEELVTRMSSSALESVRDQTIPDALEVHPPGAAAAGTHLASATEQFRTLKARLEADPRPRYVVNRDRMDHGPFTAVELLQQIASHAFSLEDQLRDEMTGQARLIGQWEEFEPFATNAARHREIDLEKREVRRVVETERKRRLAKYAVAFGAIAVLGASAAAWFFSSRGSRSDDVDIADDRTYDLAIDSGIRTKHRRKAAGARRGIGGSAANGAPASSGSSYESALAGNEERITIGENTGPDLSKAQLEAPLQNGPFITACGVPASMHVTVRVAVKMGRAVGVTVTTDPHSSAIESCIDRAVHNLSWPANPKLDAVETRY